MHGFILARRLEIAALANSISRYPRSKGATCSVSRVSHTSKQTGYAIQCSSRVPGRSPNKSFRRAARGCSPLSRAFLHRRVLGHTAATARVPVLSSYLSYCEKGSDLKWWSSPQAYHIAEVPRSPIQRFGGLRRNIRFVSF
jgi:hypothetical protein